eukprot:3272852-Alexandrium_andersonii.AAC.1
MSDVVNPPPRSGVAGTGVGCNCSGAALGGADRSGKAAMGKSSSEKDGRRLRARAKLSAKVSWPEARGGGAWGASEASNTRSCDCSNGCVVEQVRGGTGEQGSPPGEGTGVACDPAGEYGSSSLEGNKSAQSPRAERRSTRRACLCLRLRVLEPVEGSKLPRG